MYRYVGHFDLLNKMSRLAREELRHFEQVIALMAKRGIEYPQLTASRYAAGLRKMVRKTDPGKLVDTLIVGAIMDDELKNFYESLLKSEARHFQDYLALAYNVEGEDISERVALFLAEEKALIESPDDEFRFHSGPVSA